MDEAPSKHTWTDFYSELADKLLLYKNDRAKLVQKVMAVYERSAIKPPKLDSVMPPLDIDPYTVFGLFNKGITEENRRKIISAIAEEFGVKSEQPKDFDGIPILNNLNATFYAFSNDSRRGEHDIDNLWRVFEAEIALADNDTSANRDAFIVAYNEVIPQFGLGWKLSMGLYWARPFRFVNLDSRNRWFMGDMGHAGGAVAAVSPKENDKPIHDGEAYLRICDTVKNSFGGDDCPYCDFPSLSTAAFLESERANAEMKESQKDKKKTIGNDSLGDVDIETLRYWLYSPGEGAKMWDSFYDSGVMGLGWCELGDISSFGSKEAVRNRLQEIYGDSTSQKNSAHALWQFAREMKPGDVIFAKRGMGEIVGRGIVTSDYQYDADSDDGYPHLRTVEWTHRGSWHRDRKFAQKTLTDVTDYPDLVAEIESLFDGEGLDEVPNVQARNHPLYDKEMFLNQVFMTEQSYDALVNVLRMKKNVILQGAPGVGKTFAAKRLAYSMMGVKDSSRVMMVQFHQSYSYEDFVEGFRPTQQGFELAKGVFYSFCKAAAEDEGNDWFFIIDEINRGNLSRVFGELFMLIENDKRGPKNKLRLLYSHELFYVPENVYVIGMMNTADRSLAMLNYALRRRFAFFELKPGFDTEGFAAYQKGLDSKRFDALVARIRALNKEVSSDESLGEGFCIGHSYLCGMGEGDATEERLSAIVEYEIAPMLRDYWFDDPDRARNWTDDLRKAVK